MEGTQKSNVYLAGNLYMVWKIDSIDRYTSINSAYQVIQAFNQMIPNTNEQRQRNENKANLRDLIAATGLVISNWIQIVNFSTHVTMKFDG